VAGAPYRTVEVLVHVEGADEELPGAAVLVGVALDDGVAGLESLPVVGEVDPQLVGDRGLVGSGVALGRPAPAENVPGEGSEVGEVRLGADLRIEGAFLDGRAQTALAVLVIAIEDRAGTDERRCGDDQAGRLEEADPLQMGEDLGGELGHGTS